MTHETGVTHNTRNKTSQFRRSRGQRTRNHVKTHRSCPHLRVLTLVFPPHFQRKRYSSSTLNSTPRSGAPASEAIEGLPQQLPFSDGRETLALQLTVSHSECLIVAHRTMRLTIPIQYQPPPERLTNLRKVRRFFVVKVETVR